MDLLGPFGMMLLDFHSEVLGSTGAWLYSCHRPPDAHREGQGESWAAGSIRGTSAPAYCAAAPWLKQE